MVTLEQVQALRSKRVRVRFTDGFEVVAQIIDVQDDQDHDQVAYKVLEIVTSAKIRPEVRPGEYYASDLDELMSLTPT